MGFSLSGMLHSLFGGKPALSPSDLEPLEEALLLADVGAAAADRILEELKREAGKEPLGEERLRSLLASLVACCFSETLSLSKGSPAPPPGPRVTFLVGVNGTGKTTTAGKLAARWAGEGKRVFLVAGDTFRAAAAEQLEVWSQRTGAGFFRGAEGADPAAVVHDALGAAVSRGADEVLVDTAGRLHTKTALMTELGKMAKVAGKVLPGAPHQTILVLDGSTGQNALAQARTFTGIIPLTALVVTKLDGTAKGGVLVPLAAELGVPVRFVGVGEGVDDLIPFDPDAFARALVGGG